MMMNQWYNANKDVAVHLKFLFWQNMKKFVKKCFKKSVKFSILRKIELLMKNMNNYQYNKLIKIKSQRNRQILNRSRIKNGACNQKHLEPCLKPERENSLLKKKKHKWTNIWKTRIPDCNANGAKENLMKMHIISILLYAKIITKKRKIKILINLVAKIKDFDNFKK